MPIDPFAEMEETKKQLEELHGESEQNQAQLSPEEMADQMMQEEEPQQEAEVQEEEYTEEAVDEEVQEEELEASADDEDIPDENPKSNKAWKKMRTSLKQQERENKALIERLSKLEGRMEERTAQTQFEQEDQKQPVDVEPDKTIDPEGWTDWKIRTLEKKLEEGNKAQQTLQQTQMVERAKQELSLMEDNYSKQEDDSYQDKLNFLVDVKTRELKLTRPDMTDIQIKQHLEQEKIIAASNFVNAGRNPAQMFAQMAEAYGYAPEKPAPKKATKKMNPQKLERNMKRNATLIGGTSAAESSDNYSPHQLAEFSIQQLASMPASRRKQIESAIAKTSTSSM